MRLDEHRGNAVAQPVSRARLAPFAIASRSARHKGAAPKK